MPKRRAAADPDAAEEARAEGVRTWPGYRDFALIAGLRASRGRIYLAVDPLTRAHVGEVLAAGGPEWAAACARELESVEPQPARGLGDARRAVASWGERGASGARLHALWYRVAVRMTRLANAAAADGEVQDAAFARPDQRVVLVHAHWRRSSPHLVPISPEQGEDPDRLHGRAFVVHHVERLDGRGREPAPGPATLAVRTALLVLRADRA